MFTVPATSPPLSAAGYLSRAFGDCQGYLLKAKKFLQTTMGSLSAPKQ